MKQQCELEHAKAGDRCKNEALFRVTTVERAVDDDSWDTEQQKFLVEYDQTTVKVQCEYCTRLSVEIATGYERDDTRSIMIEPIDADFDAETCDHTAGVTEQ